MKTLRILFFGCTLLVLQFSCSSNEEQTNIQFQNVESELWPHFSAFEQEAQRRGFDFDLNALRISGMVDQIHEDNVAGSCRYGSHIDNEVTIDVDFWNRSSYLLREFVVFHELGHCVLLRDHNESSDVQGRCLSIMRSGLTNCRDSYSSQNRNRFLDELFFQQ